jgi:hypothetical protein
MGLDESPYVRMQRDEELSTEIVRAIAAREGVDPTELPPLACVIDVESLTRLFEAPLDDGGVTNGFVEFTYAGYRVRVEHDRSFSLESTTD